MKANKRLNILINKVPNNLKNFIIKFTPKSLINFLMKQSKFQKNKEIKLAVEKNKKIIPKIIALELTNNCNAKCVFCPQPYQMKRKKGVMSDEIFDQVLKDIKKYSPRRIMLGGMGEPFLDKKIINRIKKLKKTGVHISVTTNGSVLNRFKPKDIVESGLDEISVSMDAFDDEYLHQNKPGIKLTVAEIEKAIGDIYKYKKEIGSKTPYILLRYQILEKSNNMEDKKKEAKIIYSKENRICDSVMLRKQHDWIGAVENLDSVSDVVKSKKDACNYFCKTIGVNWSGEVSFCCMDYDNKIILGHINDNNLVEIFNSKEINKARKMFLNGTISKHPLCSGCYKN